MGILRIKNRDNVVYSPLQQNISDDDDDSEDQIIFNKDLNITSASRNGNKKFSKNVIELDNLPGSKLKRRDPHQAGHSSCCQITKKVVIVVSFVIVFITMIAVLYYKKNSPQHSPCQTLSHEWNLSFGNNVSDSCIRLLDMDNDGQLDILLSLAAPDYYHHYHSSMDTENQQPVNEFCNDTGLSHPPTGQLLAIRGCDGKQLWKHSTKSSILYIHCDQLDANQDGKHDCLISGYHAFLQAIDPRKGYVIWSANSTYLIDHWNIYQALVVPDVDHDNVDDVLVLHAGCCYYGDRQPPDNTGRFLLFSGATGQAVGTFVNISITKGVYRNPVLYKSSNNKLTVLFTSGQLSSPGHLYQIYWDVLKKQLLDPKVERLSNAKAIYDSKTKGFFVPPVIVDIQNNNRLDILVSTFDGTIALVDGQTFTPKWTINFTNYESFSIPAPGYFNNDDFVDFMLHLNYGTWPLYIYSLVMVVSGKDGTILWQTASSFPSFTSDLTLQTVEHQRDAFVFKTFNRDGYIHVDSKDPAHLIPTDSLVEHYISDPTSPFLPPNQPKVFISPAGYFLVCALKPQSAITEEVFIMDRTNMEKPIQLAENKYSYSPSPLKAYQLCTVAKPFGRGTGAIGDVDGDNQPDYISLTNLAMQVKDSDRDCPVFWQNMTLYKKTLMPSNRPRKTVPIEMFASQVNTGQGDKQHDKGLESTHFVPQQEQIWNEYFGSKQTGIYRRQHLSDGGNTMSRRSRILYYLVVLFTLLVVLL